MTRFAVTGAAGFIGWHLRVGLHAAGHQVTPVTRTESHDANRYVEIVANADVVVHAAGVNRADSDSELYDGNLDAANELAQALAATDVQSRPRQLVFLNSVRSTDDSVYGRAKRQAGELLHTCATDLGVAFVDLVLPHVFGEFGRPNYNSAVATFASDLALGTSSNVNADGVVELIHVQHITRLVAASANGSLTAGRHRVAGDVMTVPELHDRMTALHNRYVIQGTVPILDDPMDLRLFNTLRAALFENGYYPLPVVRHHDHRGWFGELTRADGTGQTSYSSTEPGIVRGDHFHFDKVERFIVIHGDAELRIRRMFSDAVTVLTLAGSDPQIVDIPTLCTHNIVNVGDDALLTLFWAGDHFDPDIPETYPEAVGAP